MKLSSKQVIAGMAIVAGLSTQIVGADTGFSPDKSYADPAAPAATRSVTNSPDFSPSKSYADPAAPAANETAAPVGFNPRKSNADPAAPAAS